MKLHSNKYVWLCVIKNILKGIGFLAVIIFLSTIPNWPIVDKLICPAAAIFCFIPGVPLLLGAILLAMFRDAEKEYKFQWFEDRVSLSWSDEHNAPSIDI